MDAIVDTIDRGSKQRSKQRRAIADGARLFRHGVDGRGLWAKRCRSIIGSYVSDLGGEDNVSSAERSLVRRIATIETELELLEARFANDGQASGEALDLYVRASGNLRRLLEAIGLKRRPREVLDPLSYAASTYEQAP